MKLTIELDDGLVEALAYLNNAECGFNEDNPAEEFVEDAINDVLMDLLGVPTACDRNGDMISTKELNYLFLGDLEAAHAIVPAKDGDNTYPIFMNGNRIIELYEIYQDAKKKAVKQDKTKGKATKQNRSKKAA